MPKASPWISSFNAGELSPLLRGRMDIEKYSSGCESLINFLPLVQGPVTKRSGFRFVHATKSNGRAALIPFEFSTEQAYVLEFGQFYMRVKKDGGAVLEGTITISSTTNATPVKVTTAGNHGYTTGNEVFVDGTGRPSLDDRFWTITVVDPDEFTLDSSTAPGSVASAGTVGKVHEIVTPYTADQAEDLAFCQSADTLYLAHVGHAPRKLTRSGHASWTLTTIAFDYVPFAPENQTESDFIAASAGTGSITLSSTGGHFTPSMVGSYVKVREILEAYTPPWVTENSFDGAEYDAFQANGTTFEIGDRVHNEGKVYELTGKHSLGSTGSTAPIHDSGYASDGSWDWQFINYGFGYALITAYTDAYRVTATVTKTFPKSTISAEKSPSAASTTNPIQITFASPHGWETGDKVFIVAFGGTRGDALNNQVFTATRSSSTVITVPVSGVGLAGGLGLVTRVDVGKNANGASAIYPSLWRWSFSAFSNERGYPRAVTFSEDRLVWAATTEDPQAMWFSRSGRYEDHRVTDDDDSAIPHTLNSSSVDVISWMQEQGVLKIGTVGGEWSPSESDDPLTRGNIAAKIRKRSSYGSREGVVPAAIEDVVIFSQRAGRKLRELIPSSDLDGAAQYPDLTVLAEHVSKGLIKELAFASEPERILWTIMDDGGLWGLTYDRTQQVAAWHQHVIGGTAVVVESIAVIPHPNGDSDQLWAIIRRTINGGTKRYIETLDPTWIFGTAIRDGFFVDSGTTYSSFGSATLTNLDYLEGQSVVALADGVALGPFTVTSGAITLAAIPVKAHVGLAYSATLVPSKIEAGGTDGPAQGKTTRTDLMKVRMYETGKGLFYGPTAARATTELISLENAQEMTDGVLFSGDSRPQAWPDGFSQSGRVAFKHTKPLPCTLLALGPHVSVSEG